MNAIYFGLFGALGFGSCQLFELCERIGFYVSVSGVGLTQTPGKIQVNTCILSKPLISPKEPQIAVYTSYTCGGGGGGGYMLTYNWGA